MPGFATRFDLVRLAAGAPLVVDALAFGRPVRFVGVGTGVDAARATLAFPAAFEFTTAGASIAGTDETDG